MSFDEGQLDRFDALLDCTDPDLFDWILGGGDPPEQHDHDVLRMLRTYWVRRTQSGGVATHFEPNKN
jgi:antitoxin CptB